MNKNMGTPKTLLQAIQNGMEAYKQDFTGSNAHKSESDFIQAYVKDFLAQRFGTAMLAEPQSQDVLKDLYEQSVK